MIFVYQSLKRAFLIDSNNSKKHFRSSKFDKSQKSNVKCLSHDKIAIQCFRQKASIFVKLVSKLCSHLIVVFANLTTIWIKNYEKLFQNFSKKILLEMSLSIIWHKFIASKYKKYDISNAIKNKLLMTNQIWFFRYDENKWIFLIEIYFKIHNKTFMHKEFDLKQMKKQKK